MTISIVNVVIPSSGDGPIADISNLTGPKTVELSGTFTGRYILLGSHNDVDFDPVLLFDTNGEENIKLTLDLALKSVRVRATGSANSGVTMNVSGILSEGSNKFTTLGTLTSGMSGVQPIIDLFDLFPPSGVEQDINFLCRGGFEGLIVVRGSMDGSNFNPIDGFRIDDQPESSNGQAPTLEFSPIATRDLIRYIQLDIQGTISGTTVVTLGGSNPVTSASGDTFLEMSEDEGRVTVGSTETILYEWFVNLYDFSSSAAIAVQINAIIQVLPASSTATFNVYLGSLTPGDTTGGTLRATISTTSGNEELKSATSASFTNPEGCLLQITGVASDTDVQAIIRALTVNVMSNPSS